ncbi:MULTISPECIES: hypothetical protein [Symbiopectobacterium]|uniref:hypothetical protein n=1 Tax=Candidatus Symbiopectobacterium sp. PLON1 TaxID=2794575 RepID=UPI00207AF309|nr:MULTISPECIES: hypothetical protein [Symbiopectobacterium]MBT9428873.1 hypothetical protein [Candidatus Symbiopectobacterium endolongispinus]
MAAESPDSYAKILLALGEGAFSGGLDGTRVFMDGTPITDANSNANFSGVAWEFRSGTPNQSSIPGFPGVRAWNRRQHRINEPDRLSVL